MASMLTQTAGCQPPQRPPAPFLLGRTSCHRLRGYKRSPAADCQPPQRSLSAFPAWPYLLPSPTWLQTQPCCRLPASTEVPQRLSCLAVPLAIAYVVTNAALLPAASLHRGPPVIPATAPQCSRSGRQGMLARRAHAAAPSSCPARHAATSACMCLRSWTHAVIRRNCSMMELWTCA
eukprot:358883-Chlamydomonas_euryale.AAC.2